MSRFLDEVYEAEFHRTRRHCGLFLADWYVHATGRPDPAARYRGVEVPLDAIHMIEDMALEIGLEETLSPVRGDVGIIEIWGVRFGAICGGPRWMMLAERGLSAASRKLTRVVRAWRIPVA